LSHAAMSPNLALKSKNNPHAACWPNMDFP
jgi:hypothetical protein